MINAMEYINMDEQERKALCNRVFREELGQRLFDLDPYNAQDYDETPETLAEKIEIMPLEIISNLLDIIEELQA